MKQILRSTAVGLGIACAIFCVSGLVFDIVQHGNFQMTGYSYTKMVLGCLATGIGWGAPAVIYRRDNLTLGIRSVIHVGIGLVVQTVTAFVVGWVPAGLGAGKCALIVLMEVSAAMLIWLGFYWRNAALARKMNRQIRDTRP